MASEKINMRLHRGRRQLQGRHHEHGILRVPGPLQERWAHVSQTSLGTNNTTVQEVGGFLQAAGEGDRRFGHEIGHFEDDAGR